MTPQSFTQSDEAVISLASAQTHSVGCNALLQLLPAILDVFVDASSDEHRHQSIVPGGNEHQSQTQTHPEKRKSPDEGEQQHQLRGSRYTFYMKQ